MYPETSIDKLNLSPVEHEQLVQMATARNISLEELVAAAVKKFLAEKSAQQAHTTHIPLSK